MPLQVTGGSLGPSEDVNGWEFWFTGQTIPKIDSKADVTGP
jgi:hypothetical protein